jgi:hypothetical protein
LFNALWLGATGMADCWVRVVWSDGGGIGEPVFIDGNYVDSAGFIGTRFVTDTGQHTFETIDAGERPTWQRTQTIDQPPGNSAQHPVAVVLAPV